jgi:hypothetical protein
MRDDSSRIVNLADVRHRFAARREGLDPLLAADPPLVALCRDLETALAAAQTWAHAPEIAGQFLCMAVEAEEAIRAHLDRSRPD